MLRRPVHHSALPAAALALTALLAGCGGDERDTASDDKPATPTSDSWCQQALPAASLTGAGLRSSAFVTSFRIGAPGKTPTGTACAFTTSELGFIVLAHLTLPDADAANAFVGQDPSDTSSVDGFDSNNSGFVSGASGDEYRMLVQKGSDVYAGRTTSCMDEETCDEAIAAALISFSSAPDAPEAEPCADDTGAEYGVLPLTTDDPDSETFALVNEDGKVAYTATTEGIDTNNAFVMQGAPVAKDAVETNAGGEVVSVGGRPVLTNGTDLEDLGYVLEKHYAIPLDANHSAVTTYEGDAQPPFIEGRFYVSESSPCVEAETLQ